jgi:hypothetical protein
VDGAVSSVPVTIVAPAFASADVRTGLFCRLFAPSSSSGAGSFGVGPSSSRSMPGPAFPKIELPRI